MTSIPNVVTPPPLRDRSNPRAFSMGSEGRKAVKIVRHYHYFLVFKGLHICDYMRHQDICTYERDYLPDQSSSDIPEGQNSVTATVTGSPVSDRDCVELTLSSNSGSLKRSNMSI